VSDLDIDINIKDAVHELPDPIPDVALLRKILAQIDDEPALWNQATWGDWDVEGNCNTARCVAGWACTLTDRHPTWSPANRTGTSPSVLGRQALGLTSDEANALFLDTLNTDLSEEFDLEAMEEYDDDHPLWEEYRAAERIVIRENIQRVAEQIAERAGEIL